jgi:beta-hydroxylase
MFFETEGLPAAATLRTHWREIRAECLALPRGDFAPWPERTLYRGDWDVYALYAHGRPWMENCVFCPRTATLLGALPGVVHAGFSRLAPATRIEPHIGYSHAVLRLHLGLLGGADCGLRVGLQQRAWREGECLLFDDTVEHEAWNNGKDDRVVLLVDFDRTLLRDQT